jgi:hypothetical protein
LDSFRGTGLEGASEEKESRGGGREEEKKSSGVGNNNSGRGTIFDIPGLSELQQLQRLVAAAGGDPKSLGESLVLFKEHFDPTLEYRPTTATSARLIFTSAEDTLFLCGLDRFGTSWEKIREHFLPTKSVQQLLNRYKNMTAKRAGDNPFRTFRDLRNSKRSAFPSQNYNSNNRLVLLSEKELETLESAVSRHGLNFETIAVSHFPGKSSELLSRAWEIRLKNKRKRSAEKSLGSGAGNGGGGIQKTKRDRPPKVRREDAESNENLLQGDSLNWSPPLPGQSQTLDGRGSAELPFSFYDDSPPSPSGREDREMEEEALDIHQDEFEEFVLQQQTEDEKGGDRCQEESQEYFLSPHPYSLQEVKEKGKEEDPEKGINTSQQQSEEAVETVTVESSPLPSLSEARAQAARGEGGAGKGGGDNCMVLENGEVVLWTKEEDREILLFSQKHAAEIRLNNNNTNQLWATLASTNLTTKSRHLIEKRYHQLMSLLAARFASATTTTPTTSPVSASAPVPALDSSKKKE